MSIPPNLRRLRNRVNIRVMYDTVKKYQKKVRKKFRRKQPKSKNHD